MYQTKRRFTKPKYGNGRGSNRFRIKTFNPSEIIRNIETSQKEEAYSPKHAFSGFAVSEKIKTNIASHGFIEPTPIQDQAVPEILAGRDVVGIASTGTGKTAAFLIPLIDRVLKQNQRTLVIVPTRELAVQIENELKIFAYGIRVYSVVCIGGASMGSQIKKLNQRPHFVIGTPGRLIDLSKQKKLNFRDFNSVVLDEVDRMLDMGFIKDVQKIISQTPAARQSLFFSATVGPKVIQVMKQFTKNPATVSVGLRNTPDVHQEVVKIGRGAKFAILQNLLDKREFGKVLIFGRTKRGAEKLSRELSKKGFLVSAIHGNKSQNQRQKSLELFKKGSVSILIATDVVARGIDVNDITHVINYELPESYDAYLHRIGRTGRAGKKGTALTFVD